jgi:hypothetical protein
MGPCQWARKGVDVSANGDASNGDASAWMDMAANGVDSWNAIRLRARIGGQNGGLLVRVVDVGWDGYAECEGKDRGMDAADRQNGQFVEQQTRRFHGLDERVVRSA